MMPMWPTRLGRHQRWCRTLCLLLGLLTAACSNEVPTPTPPALLTPSATSVPTDPSPTPAPPTPVSSPTTPPTATPELVVLPEEYTDDNDLFTIRHPSEWDVEDLSDEAEVLVSFAAPSEERLSLVVNLINAGTDLTSADLPTLIDSYLDNFFQAQREGVTITRTGLLDGGQHVTAISPGENPDEQLHLEFRFAPHGPLFTVLVMLSSEASWASAQPTLYSIAESFTVNQPQVAQALPTPAITPVAPTTGLTVVHPTVFTATTGALYIVAEVSNQTDQTYQEVQVTAQLSDENGVVLETETWNTKTLLLRPNEASPVLVIIDAPPAGWHEVQTSVAATPADFYLGYAYPDLQIEDDQGGLPSFGEYRITGRVVNVGEEDARQVEIVGTLYNEAGDVLAVESTFVDAATLAARDSLPFDLVFFGKAPGDVARYQVVAQGVRNQP